ncbi:MAG: hypothetical protein E4G89_02500 [Methanothrix sp.]|nr:MAG: hypothetical protein E4G89_02500 [Methanothrix sp.]
MALIAGQVPVSGYKSPDYSVAAQAAGAVGALPYQMISSIAGDYVKEQKDMAQKEKEMAAQIKASMSLLDSVKAIYPDFADQVDSTKMQLSDPSISSLDKMAIASNIEGVLNMMRTERQQQLSNSSYEAARAAAGGGSGGSSPPAGGAPQGFDYNQ